MKLPGDVGGALEILLAHLYFNVRQTEFRVSREFIQDEPWRHLEVRWIRDEATDSITVHLVDRRRSADDGIVDADYEIVEEQNALPSPIKMLPSC